MTQPRFSLIFVNYRSAKLLEQALLSWQRSDLGVSVEYILVNNDVMETEVIRVLGEHFGARTVLLEANHGFGEACNRGVAVAEGEYCFFLNPDTEYVSGHLTELEPLFTRYPNSLGGVHLIDATGRSEAWSAGAFPTFFRLVQYHLLGRPWSPAWKEQAVSFPDWVSGAALVIPRTVFQRLGGFDRDFFLYFEDVDLAHRLRQSGGRVWRNPTFTVRHLGGGSQPKVSEQKQAYYESQQRYFAKYRPRWEHMVLRTLQKLFFS